MVSNHFLSSMWRISVLEVSHSGQHIEGLCSRILSLLYNFFHNSRKAVFSRALLDILSYRFPCFLAIKLQRVIWPLPLRISLTSVNQTKCFSRFNWMCSLNHKHWHLFFQTIHHIVNRLALEITYASLHFQFVTLIKIRENDSIHVSQTQFPNYSMFRSNLIIEIK